MGLALAQTLHKLIFNATRHRVSTAVANYSLNITHTQRWTLAEARGKKLK